MIKYDLSRARAAVQYLVDSSYTHHHVRRLRSTVSKPRSTPFKEDTETLNELLVIGRQNLQAMENLIAVAESKRDGRNSYQQKFMAAKRQRDRKVIELEESMTGSKLTLDQKVRVLQKQYLVWNRERDALVESVKSLPWAQRNEAIREFWERKEREVDELIVEAKGREPVRRKKVYRVRPTPTTTFGQKLAQVVDKRR